jgi:hypothetical protein
MPLLKACFDPETQNGRPLRAVGVDGRQGPARQKVEHGSLSADPEARKVLWEKKSEEACGEFDV